MTRQRPFFNESRFFPSGSPTAFPASVRVYLFRLGVEAAGRLLLPVEREVRHTLQIADDTRQIVHILAVAVRTLLQIALVNVPAVLAERIRNVERKVIAIGENYLSKEFPCPEAEAYLIVTFDGCEQDVLDAFNIAKNELKKLCLDFIALTDPKVSSNVWEIRAALAKAVQASGIWEPVDTVVPLSKVADFVDFVNKLSQKEGVRILSFGHAGDGNVHLCIIKDEIPLEKWPLVLQHLLDEIYNNVYELGGLTAAEHGIGKSKRRYFLNHTAPETIALMRAVKAAFDPKGLLNPHDGYAI